MYIYIYIYIYICVCVQSNKMLNSKHIQIYLYSCDNTLKFKKNKKVGVIINAKMYLKNFKILESKNAL